MSTQVDAAQLVPVADSSDREAWLEVRRTGVTATDVAKLSGAASFRRALADKRGELRDFRNAFMDHGNKREPVIAAWMEARFGIAPSQGLFAHPENPRYLATPDGVSTSWPFDAALGEIKTTKNAWEGPSAQYVRQMQWQMFVTGAEHVLFVWEQHDDDWEPVDLEPRFVWVKRDEAMISDLKQKADELLSYMDSEEPPASPYMDALISGYLAAKAAVAEKQSVVDEYEARIRQEIGDRSSWKVFGAEGSLTWSTGTAERFSSTAFKAEHPDTYRKYVKSSATSRLTVSPVKVEEETGE